MATAKPSSRFLKAQRKRLRDVEITSSRAILVKDEETFCVIMR